MRTPSAIAATVAKPSVRYAFARFVMCSIAKIAWLAPSAFPGLRPLRLSLLEPHLMFRHLLRPQMYRDRHARQAAPGLHFFSDYFPAWVPFITVSTTKP